MKLNKQRLQGSTQTIPEYKYFLPAAYFHGLLRNIILLSLILCGTLVQAQNEIIFPGLSGEQLRDSLVTRYKTSVVLPYSQARDTMFANIYAHDDSLTGVYSGYTIYLDPTQDPTTWAYDHDIDTEHTWPKSKGAVGLAESDMYHLYPTRREVNSARANDPFAEIPDAETTKWFRLNQVLTTIPTSHIAEYSEKDDNASLFEPREDHKGNVARAMFYFYTMYQQQADSSDPDFFPIQKEVLYLWNSLDPVDSLERVRNESIAAYQGGHKNPFILDSSLVRRAYFSSPVSIPAAINTLPKNYFLRQNFPNPFNPHTTIQFSVPEAGQVRMAVYNLRGQRLEAKIISVNPGAFYYEFDGSAYPSGIYFYQLSTPAGFSITRKMLLQK